MNKPITVFVDSTRATARVSGPLVLGDTYAVTFSGLTTEEAAGAPEMIVLGPKPGEIAARSGEASILEMTTRPCVEAFAVPPVPPVPRPKDFPHPPLPPNPPVHWRGGPHGSTKMHFYVVAGGQTLAQGDLPFLWAPFEFSEAGDAIQLQGEKGEPGERGPQGPQGIPGRNGVYVAMDGLYAFHISQGDHPEDGHLWIHAQDESTLYAKDQNGNYLLDGDGNRIPLYYIGPDGHLRYRFFYADSTHVELDLGRVITREGLYALHVSDGSDGEPAGHLMLHGQDLSQLYATDENGDLILDDNNDPIPLFHIDDNGHLHFTFYGTDGQAHESLDLGDVRGTPLTWDDLTEEQKASLKGETGSQGPQGPQGDPLTFDDLTPAQKAALKGDKGDPGQDGLTETEIREIVTDTMGDADDRPVNGSSNWVTSGGLWSVEQAILARLVDMAEKIADLRKQVGAALHYKGSVATRDDLPEGADPGDCYNVVDEGGTNYAWTGSEWDALGATIDLTAYRTASAQDAIDATKYEKPSGGIPATDLASAVQAALTDARTPTAHTHPASDITGLNLSQITSPDGDTTVKANNDGTATITVPATGYGSAFVTFPDGFSISYYEDSYTAPSGGETIELVGPYDINGTTVYVPSTIQNPESFNPSTNSVWCIWGSALMFKTGPYYSISNFSSGTPTLTLGIGSTSGSAPTMTRGPATATKTLATVDQIPAPGNWARERTLAAHYDDTHTYTQGNYCVIDGDLYKANATTTGDFDQSKWDRVTATDELNAVKQTIPTVPTNVSAFTNDAGYLTAHQDISGKADSAAIAPAFSTSSTYAVGDYVTHDGLLYKCSTAISTAGAWDATKWTAVSAMAQMPAPITVDSAMSSSSTNPVQNKVVNTAIDGRVPWANAAKDAVTIGTREGGYVGPRSFTHGESCFAAANNAHAEGNAARATQTNAHAEGFATYSHGNGSHAEGISSEAAGDGSHAEGGSSKALGAYSHAEGQSTKAEGQSSHAEGQGGTAAGFASHSAGRRAIAAGGTGSTVGTAHDYAWVWNGAASQQEDTPFYHSHGTGTFNIDPEPASGSTDPATGFWIGEKKLPEVIAENTNYLPYASTTTLAPEMAVYRATATLSGTTATMPAVTITGIPTAAAYFAFELEVAVDATATALDDTAWSGWTWMDGGALPTSDYAGKTLFIACRLDCTARTIVANCYDVR